VLTVFMLVRGGGTTRHEQLWHTFKHQVSFTVGNKALAIHMAAIAFPGNAAELERLSRSPRRAAEASVAR